MHCRPIAFHVLLHITTKLWQLDHRLLVYWKSTQLAYIFISLRFNNISSLCFLLTMLLKYTDLYLCCVGMLATWKLSVCCVSMELHEMVSTSCSITSSASNIQNNGRIAHFSTLWPALHLRKVRSSCLLMHSVSFLYSSIIAKTKMAVISLRPRCRNSTGRCQGKNYINVWQHTQDGLDEEGKRNKLLTRHLLMLSSILSPT